MLSLKGKYLSSISKFTSNWNETAITFVTESVGLLKYVITLSFIFIV